MKHSKKLRQSGAHDQDHHKGSAKPSKPSFAERERAKEKHHDAKMKPGRSKLDKQAGI